MEPKDVELGTRLRTARERAGLSQGQAALEIKVHRPTITEIEAGRRRLRADELTTLASTYGVTTAWLLGEKTEHDPRVELAAREIGKLKTEDLDRLLDLLASLRKGDGD